MLVPPIEDFGRRIMICGPSNSGKSTLAAALGRRLGLPVVHLDLLQHLPNTDWQPRPEEEFRRLHDAAIAGDAWVMDGNYSRLMPQRIARATGIMLLGDNRLASFGRYLRRTLFERDRAGMLEGGIDRLNWEMVRWILVRSPKNLRDYGRRLSAAGHPFVQSHGMRQLREVYAAWGLSRG